LRVRCMKASTTIKIVVRVVNTIFVLLICDLLGEFAYLVYSLVRLHTPARLPWGLSGILARVHPVLGSLAIPFVLAVVAGLVSTWMALASRHNRHHGEGADNQNQRKETSP
jgi:hypothetical protein